MNLIASESGEVQLDLTASVGEQDNKSDFIVIEVCILKLKDAST